MLGLNSYQNNDKKLSEKAFGQKIGFLVRLFGCWHFKLSRPMTIHNETYCVCVKCGARVKFDTEELTTVGNYYYPPKQSLYEEIQKAKTE